MRRFAPQLFAQLFFVSLLLFSAYNVKAQTRPTPQQKVRNQQWSLEREQSQTPPHPYARDRRQVEAAVRSDYRQLQIVNNNLMERMFDRSSTQRITNKEIRSSLGKIKKLTERLRSSFGIPRIKANAEPDLALAPGLLQLNQAVRSFVDNPMFQQRRVYDAELVSKAGKDVSEVLTLADALRKLTKED
ncbi:MAG TPA: hypothetical protein VJM50_11420 [Pyrinomonadaceae bacterium]|nr:hypothetical protein [Pyrinomonadaceae bacterium]